MLFEHNCYHSIHFSVYNVFFFAVWLILRLSLYHRFKQLDYIRSCYSAPHTYCAWVLLNSFNLQVHNCHAIWKSFSHYIFKYFSALILSGPPILVHLEFSHIAMLSFSVFLFFCVLFWIAYSFFYFSLKNIFHVSL